MLSTDLFVFDMIFEVFYVCFFLFYTNNETNNYKRVRKGSGIFFLKKGGEKKKKNKRKGEKTNRYNLLTNDVSYLFN